MPENPHPACWCEFASRRASPVPAIVSVRPLIRSSTASLLVTARDESNKSAGTATGVFASSSVFELTVLAAGFASFGTSFITTTLSTAPFVRFNLAQCLPVWLGVAWLCLERERERAVLGFQAPLVSRRSPDIDRHLTGERRVDALGQPGEITRRIKCAADGRARPPRRGPRATMSSIPRGLSRRRWRGRSSAGGTSRISPC